MEKLEADHIVSMKEITDMEGFDLLPREQQIEVLNMDVNFVGLENQQMLLRMQKIGVHGRGTLNTAEIIRLEMLEREAVAREALKNQ